MLKKISFFIKIFSLTILVVITSSNSFVFALTQKQLNLLNANILYYDYGGDCSSSSDPGSTAAPGSGSNVFILGDSITERSATSYTNALKAKGFTVTIDASAGRSINGAGGVGGDKGTNGNTDSGLKAVTDSTDVTQIKASQIFIIALGTNSPNTVASIDALMAAIKTNAPASAQYYWVDTIAFGRTASSLSSWNQDSVKPSNVATYADASKQNYNVLSWFKTVDPNGDPQNPTGNETDANLYIDTSDGLGVHPTPAGSNALATMVTNGISGASGTTNNASGGGCCASNSQPLSGSTNAIKAMNFFEGKGLGALQAAAMVGNFQAESGVNVDPTATNSIGAHGIAQWLGGRKTALENYAKSNNLQEDDLTTQLNFSWQELTGSYKSSVLDPIKSSTDINSATQIVFDKYEVAGDSTLPKRQAYAAALLGSTNGNLSPPPNTTDQGSSSCGDGTVVSTVGYHNPFRDVKGIAFAGVDGGADYSGEGVVHPIGNGVITNATFPSGWPGANGQGGAFVQYQLTDGAASGKYIYIAENCSPVTVKVGQSVNANTGLCTMHNAYPYNESGWGADPSAGDSISAATNCYTVENGPNKQQTAYGANFASLIESLGGPKGSTSFDACTLPAGWPIWK